MTIPAAPDPAAAAAPAPVRAPTAPPRIGAGGAFSIVIGGIVGGGIFATLGIAAEQAGGATPVSLLVGGVLALLTAYAYVHLSIAFPSKGGTVTFLNRAFGQGLLAGGVGTVMVASYVVVLAVYAAAFAAYAGALLPPDMASTLAMPLTLAAIVVLAAVNLLLPRVAIKSEGLLNVGKLAILGLFVVVGFVGGGIDWSHLAVSTWPGPVPIVAAGMLVFLSYEGFELIANASDRVSNPRRTLPIALYGSVGTAMVLYVLIAIVTIGYLAPSDITSAPSHVLTVAAQAVMGPAGAVLLAVGGVLAAASAINGDYFGAGKLPGMLAEEGEVPLEADRTVRGGPVGVVVVMVLAVVIAVALPLHALSAAASAGFIGVFAMVNLASMRLAGTTGARAWVSAIGVAACLVALVALVGGLLTTPGSEQEVVWVVLLLGVPFGLEVLYQGSRRRRGV
jgi:uncharacterized protein